MKSTVNDGTYRESGKIYLEGSSSRSLYPQTKYKARTSLKSVLKRGFEPPRLSDGLGVSRQEGGGRRRQPPQCPA